MNYKTDTLKGFFRLENPGKYMSPRPPSFKSNWERRVFAALDRNPHVVKWGYEAIQIFYLHPVFQKWSVYYPDVFCNITLPDGRVRLLLVEIKPDKYTKPPKKPNTPKGQSAKNLLRFQSAMKRYENDWRDWLVNQAKWKAARDWCLKNKCEWLIISEKNCDGFFN